MIKGMMKHHIMYAGLALLTGTVFSLLLSWVIEYRNFSTEYRYFRYFNRPEVQYFKVATSDGLWQVYACPYSFQMRITFYRGLIDEQKYTEDRFPKLALQEVRNAPAWSRIHDLPRETAGHYFMEVGAGWPFVSWKGEWRTIGRGSDGAMNWFGIPVSHPEAIGHPMLLPLMPIFPGAILSTLFWSLYLVVLFEIVKRTTRAARRVLRARRGRCPSCGYDIMDLPVCPECGHALTPIATVHA